MMLMICIGKANSNFATVMMRNDTARAVLTCTCFVLNVDSMNMGVVLLKNTTSQEV